MLGLVQCYPRNRLARLCRHMNQLLRKIAEVSQPILRKDDTSPMLERMEN